MLKEDEKINNLALSVLNLSRNTLVINLRFMDKSISMLTPVILPGFHNVVVDGESIGYDPIFVLQSYKKDRELPTRQYLHMVFHCVFQHFFINTLVKHDIWDLACDIAVENTINELGLSCVKTRNVEQQQEVINSLKDKVKYLTAEIIYRHFLELDLSREEIMKLQKIFSLDSHSVWYEYEPKIKKSAFSTQDTNQNTSIDTSTKNSFLTELTEEWKKISAQMQMDLQSFSKQCGDTAGSLLQNLNAVNREKYDYSSFLKKFAVLNEVMKINDDEFDYIFYTYGLQMYGKMPLIEPLEYREEKNIKEFVIAIDTSGSTSGSLVQAFVRKTYNILKQQENFSTKINLHIIQCDTEIQETVKITNQEEFDDYLKKMKIRGLGGTDFRPVFAYVDQLIEQHEFQHLKGMIYFTDGFGTFPQKQPDYQVAVVYIDEGYKNPEVPVWAIKLVLQENEIEEM